jgi:ribosome production factor 2
MFRHPKAKSRRAKRALDARLPQITETLKPLCVIRTPSTSMTGRRFLTSLAQLAKPDCVQLTRAGANPVRPFEDVASLEFLLERNDAQLFAVATHSKKRPDNIVLGRTFGGRVLDMIEMGIQNFKGLDDVRAKTFDCHLRSFSFFYSTSSPHPNLPFFFLFLKKIYTHTIA